MRLVIKVGTSTLTHASGRIDIRHVESLCKTVSDLKNAGHEPIIVSSGAIAMGVAKLGLASRPKDMPSKQAAAAVGQCELMYRYDKLFGEYNHSVAQVLVTAEDIKNSARQAHFQNTVFKLIELGVIPVINENDTVSTAEISVGDNDTLAAIVAVGINADMLVLLSDIDGLYTSDPHRDAAAERIARVDEIDDRIYAIAGGVGSSRGTGGMVTKIQAAELCTRGGIDMIIADGSSPDVLYNIADGESVGTLFVGKKTK